jgi:hypothetical protein
MCTNEKIIWNLYSKLSDFKQEAMKKMDLKAFLTYNTLCKASLSINFNKI